MESAAVATPPNPPRPLCRTCRYWAAEKPSHAYADCRRHAPYPRMGGEREMPGVVCDSDVARFPLTLADEWCGEWVAASTEHVRQRQAAVGPVTGQGTWVTDEAGGLARTPFQAP